MSLIEATTRFQLDDHFVGNDEISSENSYATSSKSHLYRFLSLDTVPGSAEGDDHSFAVNRFEKAVAKLVVYVIEASNDGIGNVCVLQPIRSKLQL